MFKKAAGKLISLFTNKRIILLESDGDLCDSTRTIYEKIVRLNLDKKIKIYWCVEDVESSRRRLSNPRIGFISKKKPSIRSLFLTSVAKYVIYTHTFVGNRFNHRQIRIFVTHAAMPIKNSSGMFTNPNNNTYILGTSDFCVSYRKKVLGPSNNYLITGLPRNDDLFELNDEIKESLCGGLDYIVWMPTFKHHRNEKRNDFRVEQATDISLLTDDNMDLINSCLNRCNLFLIIKPHPAQDMAYLKNVRFSNIRMISNDDLLDKGISVYTFLGNSKALITDFSSVFIDYLLTNKPIAFELGDLELYKNGIGYVMDNPEDFMAGQKIYDVDGFVDFIENVFVGRDDFLNKRIDLCIKMHKYLDNKSTDRLLTFLNILK